MYYFGLENTPGGAKVIPTTTMQHMDFVVYTDVNPGFGYPPDTVIVNKNRYNGVVGPMSYRAAFGLLQKCMKQKLWSMEAPQMLEAENSTTVPEPLFVPPHPWTQGEVAEMWNQSTVSLVDEIPL